MTDVAKHPWLTQRGTTFYLRAPVPKDIHDSFGKKEVTYSLGTKDRKEANRKIIAKAKEVSDLFEVHRIKVAQGTRPAAPAPTVERVSPPQILAWTERYYQQIVDAEFEERILCWEQAQADPDGFLEGKYIKHPHSDWYLTFFEEMSNDERFVCCLNLKHRARLEAIEQAIARGDLSSHTPTAEKLLEPAQIAVSTSDKIKLTRKLMEAEASALEAILKKDRSHYDKISARYAGQTQQAAAPGGVNLV